MTFWYRTARRNLSSLSTLLFWFVCLLPSINGCGPANKEKVALEGSSRAWMLYNEQEYSAALKAATAAIDLHSSLKQDSALGESYLVAGNCQRALGILDSALMSFQAAVQSFHSTSDQKLERKGRVALADFYLTMHYPATALTLASEAVGSARVFSDYGDVYPALSVVARAYHSLARYEEEQGALKELRQIDSVIMHSIHKLELFQWQLKSYRAGRQILPARSTFLAWKSYSQSRGDSAEVIRALLEWGATQEAFGHPDSAFRAYSQALTMLGSVQDLSLHTHVLSCLGMLAYANQQHENARRYFADAEKTSLQGNIVSANQLLKMMIVACDWKLSGSNFSTQWTELQRRSSAISEDCRMSGFELGIAWCDFLRGRMAEQRSDIGLAKSFYRDALNRYERNGGFPSDDEKLTGMVNVFMRGEGLTWYDPIVKIACTEQKPLDAFALAERDNMRDLSSFFQHLTFHVRDENTRSAISNVQWNISAMQVVREGIEAELGAGKARNVERYEILKERFPRSMNEVTSAAVVLGNRNQNFRWLIAPMELSARQIQDTLQPGSALVEYISTTSTIYSILLTKDSVYLRRESISQSHLRSLSGEFMELLGDPRVIGNSPQFNEAAAVGRITELSSVLGNILVEPLLPLLSSTTKLYVVMPQDLGCIPFHTLRANGSPIVSRFNITYVPTAAALLFGQKRQTVVNTIIGIGHPGHTNWDVEYELKDIRGFYDKARMLFFSNATLHQLDTATYDVLHFTAEFTTDRDIPDNSAMTLSDGKTPFGIEHVSLGSVLDIPTPQTFIFSNISPLAGGFSRYAPLALLANGTPTVVATMWQGERKAKKYFGEIFYTSLQGGLSGSQAYHNAMMALVKKPDLSQIPRWGLYYQFGR